MFTAFYVALVLIGVSITATGLHCLERYSCEQVCAKNWRICRWAHFAIERIYYLRNESGEILYVGQTVNEDRRWEQHIADGRNLRKAKSDWACQVSEPYCSVVRYCWTYRQSMRIERRRTISLYLAFATWDAIGIEEFPRQLHNIANTPLDPRRPVKAREWFVAALFLPFYAMEGWLIPEAQWASAVHPEEFSGAA